MKLNTLNTNFIGMFPNKIELHPHNPEWLKIGRGFSGELSGLLKEHKHLIDHVGSTAIPKIKAKPVIDITIVSEEEDECRKIVLDNFGRNSIEKGQWLTQIYDKFIEKLLCNLHIFNLKEPEWRYFFSLKKYMIENPHEVKKYEKIKLSAARYHANDYENYSYYKSNYLFITASRANELYKDELNNMVYETFN